MREKINMADNKPSDVKTIKLKSFNPKTQTAFLNGEDTLLKRYHRILKDFVKLKKASKKARNNSDELTEIENTKVAQLQAMLAEFDYLYTRDHIRANMNLFRSYKAVIMLDFYDKAKKEKYKDSFVVNVIEKDS